MVSGLSRPLTIILSVLLTPEAMDSGNNSKPLRRDSGPLIGQLPLSLSLDKIQTPDRLFWDGKKKRELISFYTLILAFLIDALRLRVVWRLETQSLVIKK
jgi:hypothetical protein